MLAFVLGFSDTIGSTPPAARDRTVIISAAVMILVREVARTWTADLPYSQLADALLLVSISQPLKLYSREYGLVVARYF